MTNDFLKEVLEIARDTADGIFDRLEDFLDDNEVYKKVKESGLVDVADFVKNDDPLADVQAHYSNPKNGFVNDDGTYHKFGKTYRELEEEVAWLKDENDDLRNTVEDYKLALQVMLDGSPLEIANLSYTRLLNLTTPGLDVKVETQPDDVKLTITQNYG